MRKYDEAIAAGKRAVELQPNGSNAHLNLGSTLNYAGRVDEGINYIKQAIRLDPLPPFYFYGNLGRCYRQKGQYEKALSEVMKAQQRAPDSIINFIDLAVNLIMLDRYEEARESAAKALEINPNISVASILRFAKYKDENYVALLGEALRKAGFPEGT